MQKNNVNLRPGHGKSKNPLKTFTSKLLAEYKKDPEGYPFESSFKAKVEERRMEEDARINDIYQMGLMDTLSGLGHIIGCAVVLEFLEANREEVLKLIIKIRGV